MTMPSRGISDIQEKARGNKMKKDARKAAAPKNVDIKATKVSARKPIDSMSVGAASSLPMTGAGLGMKKGGKCGMKKYAKGGSIDGIASKGKTRGKIC